MSDSGPYQSPLGTRYASPGMQRIWGTAHRTGLWRRLWLALAREQQALGLDIPDTALEEMRSQLDTADLTAVREYERRFRHDVMAHVHHFGDQAPAARRFIHLGATSAYVTDNADLIVIRESLHLILGRLRSVVAALKDFALRHKDVPTVAYTHYQPAQLTTVGKRATLWLQDFSMDVGHILTAVADLPFRGCKGTTGTQASYLELFHGDHEKVKELDNRVANSFSFHRTVAVTGQTYPRKIDSHILDVLAGLAQSASKLGTDLRLLQHDGEIFEPFEKEQIGSSAMAYKRNPMRSERVCSLARYLISLRENPAYTAATQWFERTLDDSANRRLVLPDAFMAADAILVLLANICSGLEVRTNTVRRNVDRVMPFMATERWLMMAVQAGGDRQELHEVIRQASHEVTLSMEGGAQNNLLDRLADHTAFGGLDRDALRGQLDPVRYVGRAPNQVVEFVTETLDPMLETLRPFDFADDGEIAV